MSKVLQKFSVYDLVVMAIMAAVGIAIKPAVVPLAHLVTGPLMIPSGALAGGLYMMWLVIGYGIVKKPGTATIISIVQAILVLITGVVGSHGIMSLFTYIAPGIAMDLALLITGHRVCCRGCAVLAGAVANVTGTACVNIVFFQAPGVYLVLILAVALLSGGAGGLIAWELLKVMDKYHLIKRRAAGYSGKEKKTETGE
ncbi:MAG: ECF transporter S component [Eubacteriaceae bacterium]|nr:ECF transporter S component [Eubacteriaceae bacterium]